jgi:hypothetical protein
VRLRRYTHWASLYNFLESQVHPGVAGDEVTVECLAVLELDQHRVALRRIEQAEGKLGLGGQQRQLGAEGGVLKKQLRTMMRCV